MGFSFNPASGREVGVRRLSGDDSLRLRDDRGRDGERARRVRRFSARALLVVLVTLLPATAAAAGEPVDYERQIKPLLRDHCYACHGAFKQQSELRLDTGAA
ncbi:MAG: hypothetical protein KY476_26670, partial [Planctomycetes bacterium]|nr:hypothetical protein [Planctomycetota bacterium]